MKKIKLLFSLLVLALGLVFTNCTSDDPIYVAGEDGVDGMDGVDGVENCIACHNAGTQAEVEESYLHSVHFNETLHTTGGVEYVTSQYTNRGTCTACHTSSGFIDYTSNGGTNIDVGDRPGWSGTQTITCSTCHDSHGSFDFDTDGQNYALRVNGPVTLEYDGVTTLDMGNSNTCATCHQPRTTPVPSGTGMVTITSSRYGPHHGPQSTLLEGILGGEVAGTSSYPASGVNGDNTHRKGASCVSCHMGETTNGSDGLHSWHPTENTCTTCHTSGSPEAVTDYALKFNVLHDLLVARGYISESGSVIASGGSPLIVPVAEAQAIWNYKLLEEDRSEGVHNPKYAKALLTNSIEALQD